MEFEHLRPPLTRRCTVILLGILAVWLGGCAFAAREMFVDDAFTGFVYVRNLLVGEGFAFFPGDQPVEGVTNIAWLLLLAPLCYLGSPTVVAKVIGLVTLLVTVTLCVLLGRRLAASEADGSDGRGLVVVPAVLVVTSFEFVYFPLAGMETGLLAMLLMMMAWRVTGRPSSIVLPLLGVVAFLTHPEAVLVYPAYAMLAWWGGKVDRHRLVVGGTVYVGLLLIVTGLRWGYFQDVVPNTFHSKPSDFAAVMHGACSFLMGQNGNVSFPITGWLSLPVLLLGYLRVRRMDQAGADMLAAVCGVGLLFAMYSPADWTNLPRYFSPYLPAAVVLLWAGIDEAVRRLSKLGEGSEEATHGRRRRALLTIAATALVLVNVTSARAKFGQIDGFPGYVIAGKNLVQPAVWMQDHLPQGATIATRRIGVLAYYSQRRVLDYAYGLPDTAVARLVAGHRGRFDTPTDAALATVWRARQPDYLLEDGPIMDYIIGQAGGTRQGFSIHGINYRVVREFPIGDGAQWVLAERRKP